MAFEIHGQAGRYAGLDNARREVEYILADQPGGLDAYDLEAIQDAAIIPTDATYGGSRVYEISDDFWEIVWNNQIDD